MSKIIGEILSLFTQQEKEANISEKTVTQQMNETISQIEAAKSRFNCQNDENLLEATIFELKALEARYNYLCRLAKEDRTPA